MPLSMEQWDRVDAARKALEEAGCIAIIWGPHHLESKGLAPEAAAEWLAEKGERLIDRSVELGWEVINSLLSEEEG